jgi:predicted membrane-bound spermidine synthase
MASFMGGLVLGSVMAQRIIARTPSDIPKIYKMTQLAVCLYPLLLPVIFVVFRDAAVTERLAGIFAGTFALLPIVAGFIGGLQYPLAAHLLYLFNRDRGEPAARSAGFLYAVDVLGAMGGALVTGTLLIPLWGIYAVAFFCASINTAVLVLLCFTREPALNR